MEEDTNMTSFNNSTCEKNEELVHYEREMKSFRRMLERDARKSTK